VMVRAIFWTVVSVAGVLAGAIFLPKSTTGNVALVAIGALALGLFIWLAFAPFVVWRSTHFVFTTKQVMFRHGVFSREDRSIPVEKVNDVRATQAIWERLLGCGTLTIESAGDHGQSVLHDVPRVISVMNVLKELVEQDEDRHSLSAGDVREALRENREAEGHV
jgi:uncharacterized membrane protein YdbT with pleckstrin-like domain